MDQIEKRRRNFEFRPTLKGLEGADIEVQPVPDPPCESPTRCQYFDHCAKTGDVCELFSTYRLISHRWDKANPKQIPSKIIGDRVFSLKD